MIDGNAKLGAGAGGAEVDDAFMAKAAEPAPAPTNSAATTTTNQRV
jgi:hypothetical protein